MSKMSKYVLRAILCIALYPTYGFADNSPTIMVSIKPFYNICAKVMQSVGTPQLLLTKNASPHDYQLKPSDAKIIGSADLVVWGGPELEGYLQKPVNSLSNRDLNLAAIHGLTLLPMRTSNNWESHDHAHDHAHDHHHSGCCDHAHLINDPHFWLDPDNAIIIATAIANRLSEIDPAHANIYKTNAIAFSKEIHKNKTVWKKHLAAYKNKPYIASHDAYQYFNKYFGLDGVGAISLHPEIPPSAQRIQQIHTLLSEQKVTCIFSEPQFNYKIIDTLIAGTNVHKGQLDPLGQDKDLGPQGYFILINNLVESFVTCNKS